MGLQTLNNDRSFIPFLSTETLTTNVHDGTPALEVDSGTWYIFYKGTWYNAEDGTVKP